MSGPHPHTEPDEPHDRSELEHSPGSPQTAPDGAPASGFPEPPGKAQDAPGRTPYSVLNTPVGEPDPTEYPDPYDRREDPRAPADEMVYPGDGRAHTPVGATSTSEPAAADDVEARRTDAREGDDLDR